jgi:hypothetical protein
MAKTIGYAEAVGNSRPPKKAGPKQIRSLEMEKAENGGHTVTHRFQHTGDGSYHESETHVFGKSEGAKLLTHLTEHLGIGNAVDTEVAD